MSRRIDVTIKFYDGNKDWSEDHSLDPERSIGEVINDLLSSNRIESFGSDGTRIVYGLFKGDGVQIDRRKKVGEVLRSGETVYLSDEKKPRRPDDPPPQPPQPGGEPPGKPPVPPEHLCLPSSSSTRLRVYHPSRKYCDRPQFSAQTPACM